MIYPDKNLDVVFPISLPLLLNVSWALFSTAEATASVQAPVTPPVCPASELIPFQSQMPSYPSPHSSHAGAFLKWNLLPRLKLSHESTLPQAQTPKHGGWGRLSWSDAHSHVHPHLSSPCSLSIPNPCHPSVYMDFYMCTILAARNVSYYEEFLL